MRVGTSWRTWHNVKGFSMAAVEIDNEKAQLIINLKELFQGSPESVRAVLNGTNHYIALELANRWVEMHGESILRDVTPGAVRDAMAQQIKEKMLRVMMT